MDGVWDLLNTIFYKSCGTTYYLLVLALTLLQILLSSIAIRKPGVYEFFLFCLSYVKEKITMDSPKKKSDRVLPPNKNMKKCLWYLRVEYFK